jgi:hypothetical protein
MKRLSNGRYLKERQLGPYMEHYRLQRLSLMLHNFHPIEYKDKPHDLFQGYNSLTRLLVA